MAALVQSFPQQSSAATMLQARPSSSSGHYQSVNSKHQRGSSAPLHIYKSGGTAGSNRGQKMTAPVAPYAFTATPALTGANNPLRQHPTPGLLRTDDRSNSSPAVTNGEAKTSSYLSFGSLPDVDTSDLFADTDVANLGPVEHGSSNPVSGESAPTAGGKIGPNRYRQNQKRSDPPSANASVSPSTLYQQAPSSVSVPALLPSFQGTSKDDTELDEHRHSKQLKRYSRRSIATITGDAARVQPEPRTQPAPPPPIRTYASVVSAPYIPERKEHRGFAVQPDRPTSAHRSNSDDSVPSSMSTSRPSSKRETGGVSGGASPIVANGLSAPKPEGKRPEGKVPSIPPRGSSDAQKKLNPSPLSRPATAGANAPASNKDTFASVVASGTAHHGPPAPIRTPDSPAAQQLAALNKKDTKKEAKPSRLRRAFSFGSAAELRKASAENNHINNVAERAKLRKDQFKDEDEAREAAIVQQQEASGLGAGIYSGQGNFFTGSTDNLSISSTASSASLMLRKMGKGVKKTSRSLAGLFRPKSVIGVPAADAAVPEPSVAQVSIVTVEAEREKVNVNLDPHAQAGGGTGFPKLERNSIDAAATNRGERSHSVTARPAEASRARPSIVGGEKDRAEVLAAVKKGILKRHGTDSASSSPHQRPLDSRDSNGGLPSVPRISDSPQSSAPSTPVDDHGPRGHRRTDSVTIDGEEYIVSVGRLGENRSAPGTPRSIAARNISFSPRIQFHDTWPSGEYDRRGDIATCNRLTPSLAQAIKEELNTFKMEMEVHESSKVYTHFF